MHSLKHVDERTPDRYDQLIEDRFRRSLVLYFTERNPCGSFMMSVLSNDLRKTFAAADPRAEKQVPIIVKWLENYAPSDCWGSNQDVNEHIGGQS